MSTTGYIALGFKANPFNSNTAEREPEIAEYAVHPPYLDRTAEASKTPGVFFLEGPRGSGKSATRLAIAKQLIDQPGRPLIIPLTSYNIFKSHARSAPPLELLAAQIAFLTVESILSWMAGLNENDQERVKLAIRTHEATIAKLVTSFYLNRSDRGRGAASSDVFQLMATSRATRVLNWASDRWEAVTAVIAELAAGFAKAGADFDVNDPGALQRMLRQQKDAGFDDPLYTLRSAVQVARCFGFSGLLVQIDKVDETDWTGSDVSAAGMLINPLLTNINLHEVDGLTWTFFVWDQVASWLRQTQGTKIRFDKIPNGKIAWESGYLRSLISRRLSHFSAGEVRHLADMCVDGTDVEAALDQLIALTGKTPRNLISALDHILSRHLQRHQQNPTKLDDSALMEGMDSYAIKTLEERGMLEDANTIAKLGKEVFVTKDVQGLIRQSAQTARSRIDKWMGLRLIIAKGTLSSGAGRPVDQFAVSDPSVKRILNRSL